jgi:DNA-binding CsgD family transcriptional regulator
MSTVRHVPTSGDDFQCPCCGAWESTGGCVDPKVCLNALALAERERAGELAHSLDPVCDEGKLEQLWLAGLEALDFLGLGFLVCQLSSCVLASNRTADDILRRRDGLQLNLAGELCTTAAGTQSLTRLFEQTAQALQLGDAQKQSAAVSVPRRRGTRALALYVRAVAAKSNTNGNANVVVLLVIADSSIPVQTSETDLYQLYGFTSTEARLANLLMEGKTLDQCCDCLGIRHSTGCSHLKRLFKKTGVHRQTELVSLLFKSVGLLRLSRQAMHPLPLGFAAGEDTVRKSLPAGTTRVPNSV